MNYILFSGSYNKPLAKKVAKELGIELGDITIAKFSDGERRIKLNEKVAKKIVFVMQSIHDPIKGDHDSALMEMLMIIRACRDGKARKVIAVMPYLGFARQDRYFEGEPITIKLIAGMIKTAGAKKIIVMNIHSKASFRAFKTKKERISANPLLRREIVNKRLSNLVVVAPDKGALKYSRKIAAELGVELVQTEKYRPEPNKTEIKMISGDVKGKRCALFDDIIDTAGTVCKNANALKTMGAKEIYVCIAHGVLSGPAIERIKKSEIKEIIITDSIILPEEKQIDKIRVISCSKVIADAIRACI